MTTHNLMIRFRYALHNSRLMQIATLFGFWLAGEGFVRRLDCRYPVVLSAWRWFWRCS